MTDPAYAVVSPDGTSLVWDADDPRVLIMLNDMVLAYESEIDFDSGVGSERLKLLGTTTTMGSETLFAERIFDAYGGDPADELHGFDLVNYSDKIAAVGSTTVWEVDVDANQTVVSIPAEVQGYSIEHVPNLNLRPLRTSGYSFALYGPEDAVVWSTPAGEPGALQNLPVWHGIVDLELGAVASFEELPAPPFDVPVQLDAVDGVFNYTYDPELGGGVPDAFWENAVFNYSWKEGGPGVDGSVQTRLYLVYGGSGTPVAGDDMASVIADNGSLLGDAYSADLIVEPGLAVYLYFYVTPTTGPGYQADLGDRVNAQITGHYTYTPGIPWIEKYTRSEYEFRPASDLRITTPDMSDWGAPTLGGATKNLTISAWRGVSRFWTAVGALREVDFYPTAFDGTPAHSVHKFTIATRWDDPAQTSIDSAFDLARCRFVRGKR